MPPRVPSSLLKQVIALLHNYGKPHDNWGERERAPHLSCQREFLCLSVCLSVPYVVPNLNIHSRITKNSHVRKIATIAFTCSLMRRYKMNTAMDTSSVLECTTAVGTSPSHFLRSPNDASAAREERLRRRRERERAQSACKLNLAHARPTMPCIHLVISVVTTECSEVTTELMVYIVLLVACALGYKRIILIQSLHVTRLSEIRRAPTARNLV